MYTDGCTDARRHTGLASRMHGACLQRANDRQDTSEGHLRPRLRYRSRHFQPRVTTLSRKTRGRGTGGRRRADERSVLGCEPTPRAQS